MHLYLVKCKLRLPNITKKFRSVSAFTRDSAWKEFLHFDFLHLTLSPDLNCYSRSKCTIDLEDYSTLCEGKQKKITNTLFVIQLLVGMKIGKLCKYFWKVESHFLCWGIWFILSERSGPVGFKLAGEFATCLWLCDSLLVRRSNLLFHLFDLRIRNHACSWKMRKGAWNPSVQNDPSNTPAGYSQVQIRWNVWNVHQITENMNSFNL